MPVWQQQIIFLNAGCSGDKVERGCFVPVIGVDGCAGVREFVLPSHLSKEPAAKWIAEELKLHPVIDAGLGLGEGTGVVMLFSLLDLALALYEDQTTFDTMEIAQYERYGETE